MEKKPKSVRLFRWLLSVFTVAFIISVPASTVAQDRYYVPKSLIMPLHNQKNQLHLSVGKGGGYDFNVSYAFTDKLAVFSTATFDNSIKRSTGLFALENYYTKRNERVFRGGLGYFVNTGIELLPVSEFYAGGGISKVDNYFYNIHKPDNRDVTQAQYQTYYVQVNVGNNNIKFFDYAFGARLAYSNYSDFTFYDTNCNCPSGKFDNLWGVTIEPVYDMGIKYQRLKFSAQFGGSIFLSGPKVDTSPYWWIDGDKVKLNAFLGRLSLQYTLNFTKRDN